MSRITLESTEASFGVCRSERKSLAELIPENLWSMALGLYPEHKRSKICDRLRLSGSQFKRRLEDGCGFSNHGFVLASRDEAKTRLNPSPEVQLTLQGKERVLTFCISAHALSEILPHIGSLL